MGPVWDQLKVYGIADRIGEGYRFPTIGTAVKVTSSRPIPPGSIRIPTEGVGACR
jgi:hypothetical protein